MSEREWLKKCFEKTLKHLDTILKIPDIVNEVESILGRYQFEERVFNGISGDFIFWIDSVDFEEKENPVDFIQIKVKVENFRHHPTKLVFQKLFGDWNFTFEILKFNDDLHMEGSKEHLPKIKELMKNRIENMAKEFS